MGMRYALLLAALSPLFGQTCSHALTVVPIGPVLVYKSGQLLRQQSIFRAQGIPQGEVGDYSATTAALPVITPLTWFDGQYMSAVYSRLVPLSFRLPSGQSVTYYAYQLWRDDWMCSGDK